MIDIETLGTKPGSALVSVGACYFNPGLGDTFYQAVRWEAGSQFIEPTTLNWWMKQPNVLDELMAEPRYSLAAVLTDLGDFLKDAEYVWAKGPDFDLAHLTHLYESLDMSVPFKFYRARDVRTVIHIGRQLGLPELERSNIAHNALDDAKFQAEQVNVVLMYVTDMCAYNEGKERYSEALRRLGKN